MKDITSYRQELKSRIEFGQKVAHKSIPALLIIWDAWVSGILGNNENLLRMILELLLFASQDNEEGRILFINSLEFSKEQYPNLVNEFWEVYDDWDNIHKTDFFKIV